ncbi:MAG: virulence factor SrfB [Campylobacterales bacterium]
MEVTLIGNTGLQFYTTQISLRELLRRERLSIGYWEDEEDGKSIYTLAVLEVDPESGKWYDLFSKDEYPAEEVVDVTGQEAVELYLQNWIPLPIYRRRSYWREGEPKFDNGPMGWCRGRLDPIPGREGEFYLTLLFNTSIRDDLSKETHLTLTSNDKDAPFQLTSSIFEVVDLGNQRWFQQGMKKIFNRRVQKVGIPDYKLINPLFYEGAYLLLLRILEKSGQIPIFRVFQQEESEPPIEVNLVLDIGNARTTGLLIEERDGEGEIDFSYSFPVELRDLERPYQVTRKPFPMRCEFRETRFGEFEIPGWEESFNWGSLLRLGEEAERLSRGKGNFLKTGMSSPKRYLWDGERGIEPWYFNSPTGEEKVVSAGENLLKFVDVNYRGETNREGRPVEPEVEGKFSRRALMTFSIVELLFQVLGVINSHQFRERHGKLPRRRLLRRLVLTSPTGMASLEKRLFLEAGEEAVQIVRQYLQKVDPGNRTVENLEVIPKKEDIVVDFRLFERGEQVGAKREWGFDEGTSLQLAFIYGEVMNRYQGQGELFFQLEGRSRPLRKGWDEGVTSPLLLEHLPKSKGVTIASLDIGGGTSDLMICSYRNIPITSGLHLVPYPEFYEGFSIAGDDVLKRIVERILLHNIRRNIEAQTGTSQGAMVVDHLFGELGSTHSATDKEFKREFSYQIAQPIALYALQLLERGEREIVSKKIGEIFEELGVNAPNPTLYGYINSRVEELLGVKYRFEENLYIFQPREIERTIEQTLGNELHRLSQIIEQFQCDYLVLGGRISSLSPIRRLFYKYLPLPPARIITLENYPIGKWYPFASWDGRVEDPKTSVAVGGAIGLIAGRLKRLASFHLETLFLKREIKSTANYIGELDPKSRLLKKLWFRREEEVAKEEGGEEGVYFNGPVLVGRSQFYLEGRFPNREKVNLWPANPLYQITYAPDPDLDRYLREMPFKIYLRRHPSNYEVIGLKEGEHLHPFKIENRFGQPLPNRILEIRLRTIFGEKGYWLDTGEFQYTRDEG